MNQCSVHSNLDYLKAASRNLTASEFRQLAQSTEHAVRRRVAENIHCPAEVLSRLAGDDCAEVRAAAVLNANAPHALLYAALDDHNPDVRYEIAEDPNVNFHILSCLQMDANPYVSVRAQETLAAKSSMDTRQYWLPAA